MKSVTDILGLLENTLSPTLTQQAEDYQCGNAPQHYLTVEEISKIIIKELPMVSNKLMVVIFFD